MSRSTTGTDNKQLFPPGYKYPLSLLNERCQKNGWDKPVVDTFPKDGGFAFSVTLRKTAKKASDPVSVRLQPHTPYIRPSALEARHWGATYALYRFCNNIQLNRVLPPGPRDYWAELAVEQKKAEPHQQWMYDQDPFKARKQVLERQAQAAVKKEKQQKDSNEPKIAKEFLHAPEVKMGSQLRNLVEDVIKQNLKEEIVTESESPTFDLPIDSLIKRHLSLGFNELDVRSAIDTLQRGEPFAKNLLKEGNLNGACLELLLLTVPECRLPKHFLGQRSSAPFVSSLHRADENVTLRWLQQTAVEQGGWPARVVSRCLEDLADPDLSSLMRKLNLSLLPSSSSIDDNLMSGGDSDAAESERATEISALESIYEGTRLHSEGSVQILSIPVGSTGMQLSVCFGKNDTYPYGRAIPPMFLSSQTAPAFHRLHLLRGILSQLRDNRIPDEPLLLDVVQDLEIALAEMQNQPPDLSELMSSLQTAESEVVSEPTGKSEEGSQPDLPQQSRRRYQKKQDPRSDAEVLVEFKRMQTTAEFKKHQPQRIALPASKSRVDFLKVLDASQVVIVKGDTGSGKTTQVPQFVLDSLIGKNIGSQASIIVTQPRRLAAVSVAARVSQERAQDGSVGYSIRGETKADSKTKLLFCTTGVVLRRLASDDRLGTVTHLIIDEVHERSVEIDLLLLEARELLKSRRSLKVILMSATIDITKFTKYFDGAPVIEIPGRTFPIEDFYLEDIVCKLNYKSPPQIKPTHKWTPGDRQAFQDKLRNRGVPEQHFPSLEMFSRSDQIDYQLVCALVNHVIDSRSDPCAILMFFPGTREIRRCIEILGASSLVKKAEFFQLHANLPNEEQQTVFRKCKKFKLIVSTNVAETSITIDDVEVVIDVGKAKIMDYDPETGLANLKEKWITLSAAKQRRGRAGRSRPGQCYKLYTEYKMGSFSPFLEPEILRMPLENVVLSCKVIRRNEDVEVYLKRALDPPQSDAIGKAIYLLEEIRALQCGTLTPLGEQLSRIPLDVRLAKMLILSLVFRCVDPILTIASMLSCKPLMVTTPENREEVSKIRQAYSDMNSDLLADAQIHKDCVQRRSDSKKAFEAFCSENFVSLSALRDINTLRAELFEILSEMALLPYGFVPAEPSLNTNSEIEPLIKAIILAGLWPRVARVHLPQKAIKYDQVQAGTVRRENEAREYQLFDIGKQGMRVFTHPGSVMFSQISGKSSFLVYFNKHQTTKVYLRDATEVPMYAILLFGGPLQINHIGGGIVVGSSDNPVYLRAWPRIGVLVNQLRALLDAQLDESINTARLIATKRNTPVVEAMLALLMTDGVSH